MMLEIIMPHYKEDWSIVRPYFDMLACQKGIDFSQLRVHIVHDGTKPFPQKYFENIPCEVIQSRIPHGGVSVARNYGIDHANAKWITFCDCDDTFSTNYALKFVFDVLMLDNYDVLWNDFIMECIDENGKLQLQVNKKFNLVWLHNKYYRLDFIRNNFLRFNGDLYMSEDSAFNAIMNLVVDKKRIGHIKSPMPLYVWCYREGSVTLDPSRLLKNMIGHFNRNVYVLNEFRDRNYFDADLMVGRTLTDAYVNLTRKVLPDGWEEYYAMVSEFAKENKDALKHILEDDMKKVLAASEKEAACGRFLNPDRPSFRDWVRKVVQ